jgi:hypothetical protein
MPALASPFCDEEPFCPDEYWTKGERVGKEDKETRGFSEAI